MIDNIYVRLQPSKIHGVGVFAIKNIPTNFTVTKGSSDEGKKLKVSNGWSILFCIIKMTKYF